MSALDRWIADRLAHRPHDMALFTRALTHSSRAEPDYERLEFLGDRVLGLAMAAWLYELFPEEPEGKLSRRLNTLVTREACAEVGRAIGVADHIRLGKQARDDGAALGVNVIGDVVEALIGALYLDGGLEPAQGFVRRGWAGLVDSGGAAPKHPKSALQEWAAAHDRAPPVYTLVGRSGAHHAPRFTVRVEVPKVDSAEAEGSSKQEAETTAARMLLEKLP